MLFLFTCFFIALCGIVGFALFSLAGYMSGISFAILYLGLLFFYGDRLYIAIWGGRPLGEEHEIQAMMDNLCALSRVQFMKVYLTEKHGDSFHFVKSISGPMIVFISPKLVKYFSSDEMKFLIRLIIRLDKNRVIRYRSLVSFMFIIWELPLILTSIPWLRRKQWFLTVINFLYYPLYLLKKITIGGALSDYFSKSSILDSHEFLYLHSIVQRSKKMCQMDVTSFRFLISEFLMLVTEKQETLLTQLITPSEISPLNSALDGKEDTFSVG